MLLTDRYNVGCIGQLELSSRQVSTVSTNSEPPTSERDNVCVAADEEGVI